MIKSSYKRQAVCTEHTRPLDERAISSATTVIKGTARQTELGNTVDMKDKGRGNSLIAKLRKTKGEILLLFNMLLSQIADV